MKTTHSVEAKIGNLTLTLTCNITQLGRIRQLTGKNMLVGESPLTGIVDSNLAQVVSAMTSPAVSAEEIAANLLDTADMMAALEAIAKTLNPPSVTENPSIAA